MSGLLEKPEKKNLHSERDFCGPVSRIRAASLLTAADLLGRRGVRIAKELPNGRVMLQAPGGLQQEWNLVRNVPVNEK